MKKNKHVIIFLAVSILTFVAYLRLTRTDGFQDFIVWSQSNFLLYFSVLVILKIAAIVWPPIPGGLLTLGSIPVIGWFNAWLADTIGGIIGASIAYALGRKYGQKFLKKIFDQKTIDKISLIKLKSGKEIEGIAVLRLFYGTISEFISYGSGVIGVKYIHFLIGTFLSSLGGMILYYFSQGIFAGENIVVNAILLGLAVILFFRIKGRYFE